MIRSEGAGRSADFPSAAEGTRKDRARKNHRARSGKSLEQSRFGERVDRLRNDQVIEHPYVDERERLLESARDELIRGARLRETGRMIVIERDVKSH